MAHDRKGDARLADREVLHVAEGRPFTELRWWCHRPALPWQRAQRPRHFARALSQPGQDTQAINDAWRAAAAEVGLPSRGLDTGPEGTRARSRFQALRPQILWFCSVADRHIVSRPGYYTTGATR